MSARRLRNSCEEKDGEKKSPKEAVYQQLFHEAIATLLPIDYSIIPELGTEAEVDGKVVTGELDFYIKNGKKWAIELLRDGDGIGEHLRRIGGKYQNVVADLYHHCPTCFFICCHQTKKYIRLKVADCLTKVLST